MLRKLRVHDFELTMDEFTSSPRVLILHTLSGKCFARVSLLFPCVQSTTLLLPTQASDPAAMVAQAMAIFTRTTHATVDRPGGSSGDKSASKADRQMPEDLPGPADGASRIEGTWVHGTRKAGATNENSLRSENPELFTLKGNDSAFSEPDGFRHGLSLRQR